MPKIKKPSKPVPTIAVPVDEYKALLKAANQLLSFRLCPNCHRWDIHTKNIHTKTCVLGRALGHKESK